MSAATLPERLRKPHRWVVSVTLALTFLGLVMILSASSIDAFHRSGSFFHFFNRQAVGTVVGLGLMLVLGRSDYRKLRVLARPAVVVCLVLLVAVLVPGVGVTRGGSSRWLLLGPVTLQPSELAKLALVLFAAHALERKTRLDQLGDLAVPLVPASLVCLLVLLERDLGTTLVIAGTVIVMVFLAGARLRHVAAITLAGALATTGLILAEGYRRARLFSFLDPWSDPLNSGYQTIQGQIALGSGGWFGVGLGAGRQKWSYVPNAHTDFIYAILGEELGLVGTLAVLFTFVFFLYLGVQIARQAPDRFGMLLAGGITGWIGLQAFINMGAATGLLPITGVPLPFISFGGSSLVFTMAAIGLLISVGARARKRATRRKAPSEHS